MLFNFDSLKINSITIRSRNEKTLKSFKSAFSTAISIYNHSKLIEVLRKNFNTKELSSVKILNEKVYNSGVGSFYYFFSTEEGKKIAESILYATSDGQSLTRRDHYEKLRLMPQSRQPFEKNLRITVNPDGSLNLKVVADVYGLKELMLSKLYEHKIHSIEAYSDDLQGWRGFKLALDIAIKNTESTDFFRLLKHSFETKETEILRKNTLYRKYNITNLPVDSEFFSSRKRGIPCLIR